MQSVRGYSPAGDRAADAAAGRRPDDLRAARPAGRRPLRRPRPSCTAGMLLVAAALAAFAAAGRRHPALGAGGHLLRAWAPAMAHIMPPATVSIMQSLPREKAGSGSARQQHLPPGRRRAGRRRARLGALHRATAAGIEDELAAAARRTRGTRRASPSRRPSASPRRLGPAGRGAGRPGARRLPARHARHRARRGAVVALLGALVVALLPAGASPGGARRREGARTVPRTTEPVADRSESSPPATHATASRRYRRETCADGQARSRRRPAGSRRRRRAGARAARPWSAPSSRA